ncbi:spermidine synthase [Phycicoccus sp. BSK3Z-2]|uniref:Spermidine synthase n=1 Tax=Phycicoccus avicenniae TaxID=2828860 RepID=A0A941HZL9_9MICO|nr:spermidine synthase [Phycicoccus avicenniae]MBR7743030.1 spermidine synthase [Phycicoccus avicenniae]
MRIEELGWDETPWGTISLRRRYDRVTERDVYEVKIDDDFLMSSQFTVGEEELSRIGLAAVGASAGSSLTVLVGGLGLGYTARAALEDERVAELTVVEALQPVIDWHRRDLLPDTVGLAADPRVRIVRDDFFDLVRARRADRTYDALLVDIDHAPDWLLREDHGDLYTVEGFGRAGAMLGADGVLALWSDEPPEDEVVRRMGEAFEEASAHVVAFANPLTGGEASNTVYLAVRPRH